MCVLRRLHEGSAERFGLGRTRRGRTARDGKTDTKARQGYFRTTDFGRRRFPGGPRNGDYNNRRPGRDSPQTTGLFGSVRSQTYKVPAVVEL